MSRATGYSGMFVIPWVQTEIDHEANGPLDYLAVGASWRWWGEAIRVDGPHAILLLEGAEGGAALRARAGRVAHRLSGIAARTETIAPAPDGPLLPDLGFVLTDGFRAYTAMLLDAGRLLMFADAVPPADTELWVVRLCGDIGAAPTATADSGVICFTPGTRIAAPGGARPVEDLLPGDRVLTRDDGPQEVLWTGQCHVSSLQLFARPALRPVRLLPSALAEGRPVGDLVVSPSHRLLLRGQAAQTLYQTPEVLVAARDLVNDRTIIVDHVLREVTYIHVMLSRHQIVWANGVQAESFHPAHSALDSLAPDQRATLLAACPQLSQGAHAYGEPARRCLAAPEAAILRHDAGWRH